MKGWTYIRVALALSFALLASFGCSGPDVEKDPRGFVRIERAFLSSAGDADLIDTRVSFGGEGVWPDCFLVDGPTQEAMGRADRSGKTYRGRIDSPWTSADETEKHLDEDGALVFSFAESPGSEAPDPDRTPYFVYCSSWEGDVGQDRAHIEGTPER